MSRPSDTVVVWESTRPITRLQNALEVALAVRYHYARLARTMLTGTDPAKKGPRP